MDRVSWPMHLGGIPGPGRGRSFRRADGRRRRPRAVPGRPVAAAVRRKRSIRTTNAGTRIGRTRKVSSRTPRPRAKPSSRSVVRLPVSIEPNVPAMIRPHELMIPPVWATASRVPSIGAVLPLLLDHPGHQEDVVVLAHGHQDHEQEEADLPVEPDPGLGPVVQRLEDQLGHAQRGEVAEDHRRDQVEADPRPAQQDDEDQRRRRASPARTSAAGRSVVTFLRSLTSAGRAGQADAVGAVRAGRPARSPPSTTCADLLQRLEAGVGERVGLEDDVDPGDVVRGRPGSAGVGARRTASRPPARIAWSSQRCRNVSSARPRARPACPAGCETRADLGDVRGPRRARRLNSLDRRRGPRAERKSSRGCSTRTVDGLELADGEVASGRSRAPTTLGWSGLEVGELAVVRPRPRADDRQRDAGRAGRRARISAGTARRPGRRPRPRSPTAGICSRLSCSRSAPVTWCGGRNGQKTAPRSQCRSTGASVSAASRAIARLSAIAGPVYWILAKRREPEHPQADDHRPGAGDQGPADLRRSPRGAHRRRDRPRTSSSR